MQYYNYYFVGSAFTFGSPHKFDFNFTGVKAPLPGEGSPPKTGLAPRSPRTSISSAQSPGTPGGATAEDSDDEVENDEGDHIHFAVSQHNIITIQEKPSTVTATLIFIFDPLLVLLYLC